MQLRGPDQFTDNGPLCIAALHVKTGEVIGECKPRRRAKEFLCFLKKIGRTVAKHRRFKRHFMPTSSSWINLVERLFAEITRQRIRRGVFKSVADL